MAQQNGPRRGIIPNNVVSRIAYFSSCNHLNLRLVGKNWNTSVIESHYNGAHSCTSCQCNASFQELKFKRTALPWISKWRIVHKFFPDPPPAQLPACLEHDDRIKRQVVIDSVSLHLRETTTKEELEAVQSVDMQFARSLTVIVELRNDVIYGDIDRVQRAALLSIFKLVETVDFKFQKFDYSGAERHFEQLTRSWTRLKSITFEECGLSNDCLECFSRPWLADSVLETLKIEKNGLSVSFKTLCLGHFQNLLCLSLNGSPVSNASSSQLLPTIPLATSFSSLQVLILHKCKLDGPSLEAILSLPLASRIVHLDIRWNLITQAQFGPLLLRIFDLVDRFRRIKKVECFASATGAASQFLEHVIAHNYALNTDVSKIEHQASANVELSFGDKSDGGTPDQSLQALASIRAMKYVRTLVLCAAAQEPVRHVFAANSCFVSVERFEAWCHTIDRDSLTVLAQSPLAQNLRILKLRTPIYNQPGNDLHLNDKCCEILATSSMLGNLEELTLHQPHMTVSRGMIALLTSPTLSKLVCLVCDARYCPGYEPVEALDTLQSADCITEFLESARGQQYSQIIFPESQYAKEVREMVQRRINRTNLNLYLNRYFGF